ncbi:hypothetical protein Q5424_28060 [Conexibacter sp. JD483]|uniref:hypothetical protein n=1 Tax=unclassified Conexibacter TaxID=2627773 RepID=UPI00271AC85F|nr:MULTISPECIES: hypothetical protein [unclassified Conexibacter]MDO8184100.1 hypothetical protein [Conexibacter sp. CPCC 205706]MDO8197092.1 hypothetical protein [Conexibacter sp. CPCC 205762]MDR9372984.1 hypothetical protein [Conexibacter sp. JD483]
MTSRTRIRRVLALVLALLLLGSAAACADRATFNRVSDAFVAGGARLDPCTFSQADLESALAGIPAEFEGAVPQLREAIERGIAAHRAGDCRGIAPTGGVATTPAAGTETAPGTTTPAAGGAGTTTLGAEPNVPPVTTPAATPPVAAATPQVTTTPGVQPPPTKRSTRPLVLGAIALGALLLLALLAWGWWRLRGWDPAWAARARHSWREAGYRVSSTWAEFTDWLRLGR